MKASKVYHSSAPRTQKRSSWVRYHFVCMTHSKKVLGLCLLNAVFQVDMVENETEQAQAAAAKVCWGDGDDRQHG